MSTITPPAPAPGRPAPPAGPGPRSTPLLISILTIALGVVVVLGAVLSAVAMTVGSALVRTETRTLAVGGVTELTVAASAASLRIGFADVDEAVLEITSGAGSENWTFTRDGDELAVGSPRWHWGWPFRGPTRATLTLPSSLEGSSLDATLRLSAGELIVDGSFGDLEVGVDAGSITVRGAARSVATTVSAGGAELILSDVGAAEFSISAGSIDSRLTGSAPRTVVVDVSAGSLDLTLPDVVYDVRSDVSAGGFDNRLRTEIGAPRTVDVTISAGSAAIRGAQ